MKSHLGPFKGFKNILSSAHKVHYLTFNVFIWLLEFARFSSSGCLNVYYDYVRLQ